MEMKRVLLASLLALLIASLMAAAVGCGGSGGEKKEGTDGVLNGAANGGSEKGKGEEGLSVVGTYESAEGKMIKLASDGSFQTDAWGDKKGTYDFTDDQAGKWVDLKFDDGSKVRLSVMIAMDEVAAVVDGESGIQYTRQ